MRKITILIILLFLKFNLSAQDKIDFTVETLNNEEFEFSELYSEGPTLVSFWALWCKPCRAEIKHLQALYEKYSNEGFKLLGINQDSPKSVEKVISFISSHNLTFPIMIDPNFEIFQKFNSQSIPLTVLYNTEGNVVYSHLGYLPGDEIELEKEIRKVLGIIN